MSAGARNTRATGKHKDMALILGVILDLILPTLHPPACRWRGVHPFLISFWVWFWISFWGSRAAQGRLPFWGSRSGFRSGSRGRSEPPKLWLWGLAFVLDVAGGPGAILDFILALTLDPGLGARAQVCTTADSMNLPRHWSRWQRANVKSGRGRADRSSHSRGKKTPTTDSRSRRRKKKQKSGAEDPGRESNSEQPQDWKAATRTAPRRAEELEVCDAKEQKYHAFPTSPPAHERPRYFVPRGAGAANGRAGPGTDRARRCSERWVSRPTAVE